MPSPLENAAPDPMKVVELEAFTVPENTPRSTSRRLFATLKTWLTGKRDAQRQAIDEEKLRKLPEVRLAHLVPPVDWSPAADDLAEALDAHLARSPIVFFITPPYGGHEAVVAHWAKKHGVALAVPPTLEALLTGETRWREQFAFMGEADGPRWALPALERCLLRSTRGIHGVRAFLTDALAGKLGRGVIGCDSWSYAYLAHLVGLEGVPTLTLAALEGEALAAYFTQAGEKGARLTVYSARTGHPLVGEGPSADASQHELQILAAHCRGHLGVAWHYWRERLREPVADSERDGELWLLDALAEAELSNDTGDVATLVLHALLLHGGLDDRALGEVLPYSHHEVLNARLALTRRELVVEHGGRWQVAPLAYASVRALLVSRNYLVDPL
ncbi:hypothetical protein [Vreelandella malpeensis]|uniref:Uncharacterized protein n=1 Tax=Vreelandella malpeensis TaxID=1172368 RepID=A0ABS8DR44_9GAMM|nr:hypothetical protein [Halomonas malpeensis]MCB8888759.1 hypothetical protein [Halomonas malpeensis]